MLQDYVGVLDMRPADESTAATPNDRSIVNDRGNMIPGTIGGGTIPTVANRNGGALRAWTRPAESSVGAPHTRVYQKQTRYEHDASPLAKCLCS